MKYRDEIPLHRLNRTGQRIGISDKMSENTKNGFLANVVDEHYESYRRLGVPEDKISLVMSMSTRVREFFGWERGLEIVLAYRRGDVQKFRTLLKEHFKHIGDTDIFTGYDVEMMLDMIGADKTLKDTEGLMNKVKGLIEKLRVNTDGLEELRGWIKRNSMHFYEIGYKRRMSGTEVSQEFTKADALWQEKVQNRKII